MGPLNDAVRRLQRLTAFKPSRWSTRKAEVVQGSWKKFQSLPNSDATTRGICLFRRFLKRNPAFLQLFPFRDQPHETLFLNAKVRLHGKLFMDTLSKTIAMLGDAKSLKSELFDLGSRHADLYRVKPGHYDAMGLALLEELEANLEEWDEETKTAWQETWAHIVKLMQAGAGSRDVSNRGTRKVGARGSMATRVDSGEGFERILPAQSPPVVGRGGGSPLVWWVPVVGLGILFLGLEVMVHEYGASFLPNLVNANVRGDLVDVGGVDSIVRPSEVPSVPSEASGSSEPSESSDDDETQRWSMLLPDVTTDGRVFASRGPHSTLGFACFSSPIPNAETERVAITRFEPVTTRSDSVHHITVFGCDARVEERWGGVTFGDGCASWQFTMADKNKKALPCRVVLYAYDKGARAFEAPGGTAVHAGLGTGITHIMYQVHYLAPKGETPIDSQSQSKPTPWVDRSGVRFDLTHGSENIAKKNLQIRLGILATMHTRMTLPVNEKQVDFEYTIGPFAKRMAPDFLASENNKSEPEVTLVAAHMHGHGMLTRYEFGIIRDKIKLQAGVLNDYRGYGDDQSFKTLPVERKEVGEGDNDDTVFGGIWSDDSKQNKVTMRGTDYLYVKCTFDTSTGGGSGGSITQGSGPQKKPIPYGVGHGEEMCGQLVYYYPFATAVDEHGAMVRPEPREDDVKNVRDNDLFNIVFGDQRVNTTVG